MREYSDSGLVSRTVGKMSGMNAHVQLSGETYVEDDRKNVALGTGFIWRGCPTSGLPIGKSFLYLVRQWPFQPVHNLVESLETEHDLMESCATETRPGRIVFDRSTSWLHSLRFLSIQPVACRVKFRNDSHTRRDIAPYRPPS